MKEAKITYKIYMWRHTLHPWAQQLIMFKGWPQVIK